MNIRPIGAIIAPLQSRQDDVAFGRLPRVRTRHVALVSLISLLASGGYLVKAPEQQRLNAARAAQKQTFDTSGAKPNRAQMEEKVIAYYDALVQLKDPAQFGVQDGEAILKQLGLPESKQKIVDELWAMIAKKQLKDKDNIKPEKIYELIAKKVIEPSDPVNGKAKADEYVRAMNNATATIKTRETRSVVILAISALILAAAVTATFLGGTPGSGGTPPEIEILGKEHTRD